MSSHCNPSVVDDGLVFLYDVEDIQSYKGEPVVNIWSVAQGGGSVNNRTSWDRPNAYNGDITDSVYTGGTWNGNRIWEVLHTEGTTGYGGYESWRLCVSQPTAGSYSSTRRVAIKICILEGSISDLAIHSGGGNSSHNSSYFTAIPESQVPKDCPIKSGWYQFLAPANWTSTTVTHCVGLGFITYNRVKILTAEPMYYPSDHLIPFSGTERSSTEGLLDRTGNSTIDISNASFDSNAQMTFDGTDDYIEVPNTNLPAPSTNLTMECVFQRDSGRTIINYGPSGFNTSKNYGFECLGSNPALRSNINTSSGSTQIIGTTVINSNTKYYGAMTYDGSSVKLYVNGKLEASASKSGSILNSSTPSLNIGRKNSGNGEYINGEIPIVKLYNRALTSTEVLQNFNAIKSRFNL